MEGRKRLERTEGDHGSIVAFRVSPPPLGRFPPLAVASRPPPRPASFAPSPTESTCTPETFLRPTPLYRRLPLSLSLSGCRCTLLLGATLNPLSPYLHRHARVVTQAQTRRPDTEALASRSSPPALAPRFFVLCLLLRRPRWAPLRAPPFRHRVSSSADIHSLFPRLSARFSASLRSPCPLPARSHASRPSFSLCCGT